MMHNSFQAFAVEISLGQSFTERTINLSQGHSNLTGTTLHKTGSHIKPLISKTFLPHEDIEQRSQKQTNAVEQPCQRQLLFAVGGTVAINLYNLDE